MAKRRKARHLAWPFSWWSCRESNPLWKSRSTAETLNLSTRNDANRRETTCGNAAGVDGINTLAPSRSYLIRQPVRARLTAMHETDRADFRPSRWTPVS